MTPNPADGHSREIVPVADRLKKTGALVVLLLCVTGLSGCVWQAAKFWVAGDEIKLREPAPAGSSAADKPKLLIVAIDGIDRHLLYDSLRRGELPEMARLLGDDGSGGFAHAYFDETLESTRCPHPRVCPGPR